MLIRTNPKLSGRKTSHTKHYIDIKVNGNNYSYMIIKRVYYVKSYIYWYYKTRKTELQPSRPNIWTRKPFLTNIYNNFAVIYT